MRSSRTTLSRGLWVVTWLYFMMYAGIGIFFTYFSVYMSAAGMSGTEIGVIIMSAGIVSFFASTLWGYVSDAGGKPRILLSSASLGTMVTVLLIPLFPSFWGFLVLNSIFSFFNSALLTLMDSTLMAMLGDRRADYGKYRLGGTFGFIVTTLLSAFLFDHTGLIAVFPSYAICALIFAILALQIPDLHPVQNKPKQSMRSVVAMMRQSVWLVFALCVFLTWIAGSGAISFLSVTLKSMGASDLLIGVVAASAAIFEIPFMAFGGWFLRRFGSRRLLVFSMVGYVFRISAYALMPTPVWGILASAFNGVSYALFWNAAITYANENAPDAMRATALGLFISTTSLAGVASALLSGWLFDHLGPRGMFGLMAGVAFLAFIIFAAFRPLPRTSADTIPSESIS